QRLPLPELRASLLVIAAKLRERNDEAARLAGRPQTHVHLVQPPARPEEARHLDDPLAQFGEEVKVVRELELVEPARPGRRAGSTISFVDQDQIQVAVVVHLPTAELA